MLKKIIPKTLHQNIVNKGFKIYFLGRGELHLYHHHESAPGIIIVMLGNQINGDYSNLIVL